MKSGSREHLDSKEEILDAYYNGYNDWLENLLSWEEWVKLIDGDEAYIAEWDVALMDGLEEIESWIDIDYDEYGNLIKR